MDGDEAQPESDGHGGAQVRIGDAPLDAGQQLRIRATHRGFTYQHLYAVGCLLRLRDAGAQALLVERDEDLEVVLPGRHLYLQVKTRQSGVLVRSDIRDAVDAYVTEIRPEHDAGRRSGTPALIVVTNARPGRDLLADARKTGWPDDVRLLHPGGPPVLDAWLPHPAADLDAMLEWCTAEAGRVPFPSLRPQTLVEKLAARVQYASTGARGQAFVVEELPRLFEQFVEELRALPEVPDAYRPQQASLQLISKERVRLVVGYSGAGKTTWASYAAQQCPLPVTYCDVSEGMSGDALAESLARELAARHLSNPAEAGLPHGSSAEVLRAVHLRLTQAGVTAAVVIDNAHRLPVEAIRMVVDAQPSARLVLLAQPRLDQAVLEAHLGITAQAMLGWSVDTIADVFEANGCRTDYPTARRVGTITGSLPLYVGQAARLTRSDYGGDAAAFCAAFEQRTHATATAQELILEAAFSSLDTTATTLAGLLALAEVPLTRDELRRLAAVVGLESPPANARALRILSGHGLTQFVTDGRLKLHDAARHLALSYVDELDDDVADRLRHGLCELLEGHGAPDRLSRWMRLLGATGQIEQLVSLTEHEAFFERGYPRELRAVLDDTANAPDGDAALRFDAHNALSIWTFRDRDLAHLTSHVQAMEELLRVGHPNFGPRETTLLACRRIRMYAMAGDTAELHRTFAEARARLASPSRYEGTLRFEYAAAVWDAGEYEGAMKLAWDAAREFMRQIGLEEEDLTASVDELSDRWASHDSPDDFKRLADCFDLIVVAHRKLESMQFGLWAMWAMKFYEVSGAPRSAINSGQDVADVLRLQDPQGALGLLDQLLQAAENNGLPDMVIGVRSQRAEVLARLGDVSGAREEIALLSRYELTSAQELDLQYQSQLIEEIAKEPRNPFSRG
ncbi:AAA family ATPase [Streptomyces erythrochromogenes]|uniref:AAA family ATPase n=1 Tax=Streptomyces erythrochromogenes TaxID=285574 RepID=UPI0038039CE1